jgi:hypothetical protein
MCPLGTMFTRLLVPSISQVRLDAGFVVPATVGGSRLIMDALRAPDTVLGLRLRTFC